MKEGEDFLLRGSWSLGCWKMLHAKLHPTSNAALHKTLHLNIQCNIAFDIVGRVEKKTASDFWCDCLLCFTQHLHLKLRMVVHENCIKMEGNVAHNFGHNVWVALHAALQTVRNVAQKMHPAFSCRQCCKTHCIQHCAHVWQDGARTCHNGIGRHMIRLCTQPDDSSERGSSPAGWPLGHGRKCPLFDFEKGRFQHNVSECLKCLQTFCLCNKRSSNVCRHRQMSENVFWWLQCLNKSRTLNANVVHPNHQSEFRKRFNSK